MARRKRKQGQKTVHSAVASDAWLGEVPTPERLHRAGDHVTTHKTSEGRTAIRFTDSDILEHMESRGMIDADQYACGKRWAGDWYQAGLAASGVVDPGRVIVDGGNPEPGIIQRMEHAHHWAKACKAIGPVHCHPLTDMVLLEMPATVYAMRHLGHRDPKDARLAAYTLLRSSLDALVLHYLGARRQQSRYSRGGGDRQDWEMDVDGARAVLKPS